MKTIQMKKLLAATLFAAALLGAATPGRAQTVTTSITNTFDTAASVGGWTYWYDIYAATLGYNATIMNWDGTVNNGGPAGSGSLVYSNIWPGVAAGTSVNGTSVGGQNQIWGTFANNGGNQYDNSDTIDGTKYDSVSFDIRANPGCPMNLDTNVCQLTVGLFCNYNVGGTTNVNVPPSATNGWYHVVALINKGDAALTANLAWGWAININCYGAPNSILFTNTTPTTLWIDNIQVNRSRSVTPPPSMIPQIVNVTSGLNLYSGSPASDQYQRTNLKLANNYGVGWGSFDGAKNTTYSWTIADFPGAQYSGYQSHLFITTGPGTSSSLDYGETNVVWMNVSGNADGTAGVTFRYKIFEPNSNANMFGAEYTNGPLGSPWAGTLVSVTAPSPIGTWSLTFNNDTNVTMTGPGVSTNFNINPAITPQFQDPLNIAFGAQPNNSANVGQEVVLSVASITNTAGQAANVVDYFTNDTALDTNTWTILTGHPNTVQLFPSDPGAKLVSWTIPDTGYGLWISTNLLKTNAWTALTGNESSLATPLSIFTLANRVALVPSADLGPNQNYFRMATRAFAKLQVLMPGETAAPGTPTGKTGTPTAQSVGVPFNITVNAVDANWYPAVTADDTVDITSSDSSATLPADANLAGGTASLSVTFGTAGTFTVTATDVTTPSRAAGTSAATQAQ
jgi:hypothetical protein